MSEILYIASLYRISAHVDVRLELAGGVTSSPGLSAVNRERRSYVIVNHNTQKALQYV